MVSMLVVGLLFLAGCVYNIFGAEPDSAEAIATGGIAALLIGLYFATRDHRARAAAFQEWVVKNAGAIERGGALYGEGILVTPATVLTRYQIACSFLIMTYKVPTRIYIVDHDSTTGVGAACTVLSLALGWWGFPWGPVYTVQAVQRNVRGGFRHTVADYLKAGAGRVASPQGGAA